MKKIHLKMNIFIPMKYCCILHGHVSVMAENMFCCTPEKEICFTMGEKFLYQHGYLTLMLLNIGCIRCYVTLSLSVHKMISVFKMANLFPE